SGYIVTQVKDHSNSSSTSLDSSCGKWSLVSSAIVLRSRFCYRSRTTVPSHGYISLVCILRDLRREHRRTDRQSSLSFPTLPAY
ncbi:hypothetical protein EC957_000600, partial [Mortierella hygrophila]